MRNENVPNPPSPETPPLAPHDPPDPAPQAAAWQARCCVIGHVPPKEYRMGRTTVMKSSIHARIDRRGSQTGGGGWDCFANSCAKNLPGSSAAVFG